MAPVVGIDLGTTNTVVAAVRDAHASALADIEGQILIPSVVSFHPSGAVLVGREAKQRRGIDGANTIYSVKRLIGRSWDTEEVRKAARRFPFEMREGPGQAALVVARGETYTLPEISAFVLRKAKDVAQQALGVPVERAVITVPANFNDLQRAATKVAGRVAGLEVLRIVNEPTAAALAYGYGRRDSERIAVYDFGGGTFDVTLLDLSDNVFEVLATAGSTFLGGDDIDMALAERMADALLATHRYDARTDRQVFERLVTAAEGLKTKLSFEERASVELEELAHGPGGRPLGLRFTMTRAELEQLAEPFLAQTFDVCREALNVARLTPGVFDQVLLVGGSTRIPLVRRRVEQYFGRPPLGHLNPDEVVAIGAAIQAAALTSPARRTAPVPPPPNPSARAARTLRLGPDAVPPLLGRGTLPSAAGLLGGAAASARGTAEHDGAAATRTTALGLGLFERPQARRQPHQTLASAGVQRDEALRGPANQPERPLPAPAAAREESVATALSEADFEPLETPAPRAPSRPSQPTLIDPFPETEPLPIPEIPEPLDEPTRVRAPLSHAPPATPSRTPPPLLIDVTPLTLSVETVQGFCDAIIERNSPVPCERTRIFATATDNQTSVRVRVSQGESRRFDSNTVLGEVELGGLRPAPRGAVRVAVTFALDNNGMLNVSAEDVATRRATAVAVRLVGLPDVDHVEHLRARHQNRPVA
jgi:molecular chaperone DnaK